MRGHVMVDVMVSHERTARHNSSPQEIVDRLRGRRVVSVERHGKFLRVPLDDGQTIVAHLGMSGRWTVDTTDAPHTHFVSRLDDDTSVAFVDPRTFGFVAVYEQDDLPASGISRLGPDAWDGAPDAEDLLEVLSRRTAPIKAILLDQGVLAGLGNIYADEVLFRMRIHPLTPANRLSLSDVEKLLMATKAVLSAAIDKGGTTLDDLAYLLPDGRAGENLESLAVYGREDEPCLVCGTPIQRVVVRARSSHFCPGCQPPP